MIILDNVLHHKIKVFHFLAFLLFLLAFLYGVFNFSDRASVLWLPISIAIFGMVLNWNKGNVAAYIFSIYYLITVPVQMSFSFISPESIQNVHQNGYGTWLFEDNRIVTKYFMIGTLFYLIATFISRFIYSIKDEKIFKFANDVKMHRHPEILLFLYVVTYIMSVHLYNGYIDYFLRGLGVVALGGTTVKAFKKGVSINSFVYCFCMLFVYAVPGLIFGRRNPLILGALMVFIYCFSINSQVVIEYFQKHKTVLLSLFVFFTIGFGLINMAKFGEFMAQ